jgi:hypothetical protein
VRWNIKDNSSKLFKAESDWDSEYVYRLTGQKDPGKLHYFYDKAKETAYRDKWLKNAVERIIVLSPGAVYIDTFNGAMLIRGENQQVFGTKEEALAALYQTDLKPSLGKVVAMDRAGHLWWMHRLWGTIDRHEIRCYDGKSWKTIEQPPKSDGARDAIAGLLVDTTGTLWAYGPGGIYRRQNEQWEPSIDGWFNLVHLGRDGTLWAFDRGRLGKYDGSQWEFFEGKERCKDFFVFWDNFKRYPVFETGDGQLWFYVSELGVICFDGKSFNINSEIHWIGARITGPEGQMFVASGQRLWTYDQAKWKSMTLPDIPEFKIVPRPLGGGEGWIIRDLCVASDGTLYLGTYDSGLFKFKDKKWKAMKFPERTKEAKPELTTTQQAVVRDLEAGKISPEMVEMNYKAYIEGEGKKLVHATDDQLAENIVNGSNATLPMISYYRLVQRDKKRAEECLHKKVKTICAGPHGEWTSMQLLAYGPPAITPLLEVAKTGSAEQRRLAVEALALFQDKETAEKLLSLLRPLDKEDPLVYLLTARAAVMAGDPKGIELLIEAGSGSAAAENQLVKMSRQELQKVVSQQYDDLPEDWSRESWKTWWEKHRSSWQPGSVGSAARPQLLLNQQLFQEIARQLEAGQKGN